MPLTPTRKQPLDATLTALAGVTTAADRLIYATGADAFATTDLTSFGRSLLDDADAAAARATLGLGTMATAAAASYLPLAGGTVAGNLLVTGVVKAGTNNYLSLGEHTQVNGICNVATNADGDCFFGSNLRCTNSELGLRVAVSHSSLSGSGIYIPGASKAGQGSIQFFTTPTGSVTAGDAFAQTAPRMVVTNTGLVGIGAASSLDGMLHIVPNAAATKGIFIKGAASQTANLTEWQDSSGTVLAKVDSAGNLSVAGGVLIATTSALTAGATGNAPTMTGGPVTGEPTKWIPINDNGTTRYIPTW